MTWQQLTLTCTPDQLEILEAYLLNEGSVAITLLDAKDQPIFEPDPGTLPLWTHLKVQALFENDIDLVFIKQHCKVYTKADTEIEIQTIEDQPWERAWLDYFKPMHFGNDLWICPSEYTPPNPNGKNILLDPGLAFGTGTHPTTQMCLQWLAQQQLKDKVVLDYGCGSGILAIAAFKMGSRAIDCVDIDPQALTATQSNANQNNIASEMHTFLPEHLPSHHIYDLIMANILQGPLLKLAPILSQKLKQGGTLLLSGLLAEQVEEVKNAYDQYAIQLTVWKQVEEWVSLLGQKA